MLRKWDGQIEDAPTFNAFSCEYVANLLEARARVRPLQLTGRQDLLELEMSKPDLSLYAASQAAGGVKREMHTSLKPAILAVVESGYISIDKFGPDYLFQIISARI